jgi:putative hydrolase
LLKIDLHTHTLNSGCGHHTLWEVLNISRSKGVEMIAITDHGPAQNPTIRDTFWTPGRIPPDFEGMRILKGMEANVLNTNGDTDVPARLLNKLDIILIGLHPKGFPTSEREANTEAVLRMLEREPAVDIITHPDIRSYPLDLDRVVPAAVERGVAFELNNTNLVLNKTDMDQARRLVELGRKHGAMFAIDSDGHTWIEYARDDEVRQWLRDLGSPALDIVSDWPVEKAFEHFAARKRARAALADR